MSPMERLYRESRDELFDATEKIQCATESELIQKSTKIINDYRKRRFDIVTEQRIVNAKREEFADRFLPHNNTVEGQSRTEENAPIPSGSGTVIAVSS